MIRAGNVVDDDVVDLYRVGNDVGNDSRVERLASSELEEERAVNEARSVNALRAGERATRLTCR